MIMPHKKIIVGGLQFHWPEEEWQSCLCDYYPSARRVHQQYTRQSQRTLSPFSQEHFKSF